MGVESEAAVAPPVEAIVPETEMAELSTPDTVEGYEYTHEDGSVHKAETAEVAQRMCPVLGKMAVHEVEFMLKLAERGRLAQEEKDAETEVETETETEAEVDQATAEADTQSDSTDSTESTESSTSGTSTTTSAAAAESMASSNAAVEASPASFSGTAETATTESAAADVAAASQTSEDTTSAEAQTDTETSADISDTSDMNNASSEESIDSGGLQSDHSENPTDTKLTEVIVEVTAEETGVVEDAAFAPTDLEQALLNEEPEIEPDEAVLEDEGESIDGAYEPNEALDESIEPIGSIDPSKLFESSEIALQTEETPEMTDAVIAFLKSPVSLYGVETDSADTELSDETFESSVPIVAEVVEKLEQLEGDDKAEVNEMLSEIVEIANELDDMAELENGVTLEEIEAAEAELKEKVEELFIKLGIEYTDDDVDQFIRVLRKSAIRVPEVLEEAAAVDLEEDPNGTREVKTKHHGIAALLDKAELTAQQLIGKLALFHAFHRVEASNP